MSFPIDVRWADASGRAIAVGRGVAADDATPRCHSPARRVLEVAASELAPIVEGDRLIGPRSERARARRSAWDRRALVLRPAQPKNVQQPVMQ
ncbi:MAG: hypothetical protein M5U28_30530 [Sandaracinaceae bacterium]|nr:hypothetical protein [Sandaracinaceae bacterium]